MSNVLIFHLPHKVVPVERSLAPGPWANVLRAFLKYWFTLSIFWPLITTCRERQLHQEQLSGSPVIGGEVYSSARERKCYFFPQIKEWSQKVLRRPLKRKSEANSTLKIDINNRYKISQCVNSRLWLHFLRQSFAAGPRARCHTHAVIRDHSRWWQWPALPCWLFLCQALH